MNRLAAAGVAVVLLAAACSGSSEAVKHNNAGVELNKEGRWAEAVTELDKAIELDPNLAVAYNNRGRAHKELGQAEQAFADYDKAIELDPNEAVTYYNRGSLYDDLEQYEQAIADYDKAIELEPGDWASYVNRGFAHLKLEHYEQAIADYDKAIEMEPDHALTYANRGTAYSGLDQREQARADYQKAMSLTDDPALSAQIQEALDRLATAWPSEWEAGVCGAYTALSAEVDARGSALRKAKDCPQKGDCTDAALAAEEAAEHADKMIALLEGVPSWPPGQPWVDNLMTQAIGYRDVSRAMAEAFRTVAGADAASLLAAYVLGTLAMEQPTYLAAREASDGLTEILRTVYEETGFLCPS